MKNFLDPDRGIIDEIDDDNGFEESIVEEDINVKEKKIKCTCGLDTVNPNYAPWQHYKGCPKYKPIKDLE